MPTAVRDLLAQQLDSIASAGSGALGIGVVVGIASALWSASSGFGHLIEGLNIAYDEDDNRSFWQRKLVAFGFTLGFLVLVFVVVTILSTATGAASGAAGVLAQIVGWLVVAVLFGLFLAIVYRYGPHRDEPEWSWVSPGSIFAVIAWTIMTVAFGFYVANFASYNETYGSLGAIVITLNWMYFTAVIVVVGAEITTEIERQTTQDSTEGVEQPMGRREATAADEVGESSAD